MSCHTLGDAVTDVARGRDVGPGTVAAVEAHIEHCESCRLRFTRERRLSEGLRALAESARDLPAPAALESRLLEAFAAQQSSQRRVADTRQWMRAAAAVLLTAGLGGVWWASTRSRGETPTAAATSPAIPRDQPRAEPPPASSSATAAPTQSPAAAAPSRMAARPPRPKPSRIVRPEGFVALPSAAGLPDFESGEIVRVELPLASLPLYGIDIVPDAKAAPVEADFLVGQDGRARAIRLVRTTSSPSNSSLK